MVFKRSMMRAAAAMLVAALLGGAAPGDDPLLRPIEPEFAKRWLGPVPPERIFGNTYLVGFEGLNVALIRTSAGLILIDGAVPQGVRAIEANLRQLGFRLRDVKLILSTEPHYDHAGGIPALARDTGATVVAGRAALASLRTGQPDPADAQTPMLSAIPAIRADRLRGVSDGETVRLGGTVVTALATPGHTRGSTSWTWRSCEGQRCVTIVFASSMSAVSAKGYRFSDPAHASIVSAYRRSFQRLRRAPCDVLFTAHPDQSGGDRLRAAFQRSRDPNPFLRPGACRTYAGTFEARLDQRLKEERAR